MITGTITVPFVGRLSVFRTALPAEMAASFPRLDAERLPTGELAVHVKRGRWAYDCYVQPWGMVKAEQRQAA